MLVAISNSLLNGCSNAPYGRVANHSTPLYIQKTDQAHQRRYSHPLTPLRTGISSKIAVQKREMTSRSHCALSNWFQ